MKLHTDAASRFFPMHAVPMIVAFALIFLLSSSLAVSASTPASVTLHKSLNISNGNSQFVPFVYTSPNAELDGHFGAAVALSGNTLVVGAPQQTVSLQSQAGVVYIFNTKSGTTLTIVSPITETDGHFGQAVAISGGMIVVGAPGETVSGLTSAGHAYVFSAATGTLIKSFSSPNAEAGGEFGLAVAISGDDVVVGAPEETVSGMASAGHAYILDTTAATVRMLSSPNVQGGGEFGFSVSLSGSSVIVGAPGETVSTLSNAGNAYTFNLTTGNSIATFSSPGAQAGGRFGDAVSISGSLVLVGAPEEMALGDAGAGNAYTFSAATAALVQALSSPAPATGGQFGVRVAINSFTALVGAPGETGSGIAGAGNAYTFSALSGALLLGAFTSPNPVSFGSFGSAVAISGNMLAIGAGMETASGLAQAGHLYVSVNLPLTLSSDHPLVDGVLESRSL